MGFTGNLVAAVWFGNDDYSSTNNMTGGSLPAMAWQEMMAPAHQSVEIKPIPGIAPAAPVAAVAKNSATPAPENAGAQRPTVLNKRSLDALGGIETCSATSTRAATPAGLLLAGNRRDRRECPGATGQDRRPMSSAQS